MVVNLLQILGFFSDDGIELLNANFAIIGKLYGYMIQLSTTTNARNLNQYIGGLTKSFYTIAGIFMLFRLSVSVFNYIIEPDKMSDSKTSPGKLITNVVLTIILLVVFMPGGFVISALDEVENVFLYNITKDDGKVRSAAINNGEGFFSNLFSKVEETTQKKQKSQDSDKSSVDILYNDLLLVDDVKAIPGGSAVGGDLTGNDKQVKKVQEEADIRNGKVGHGLTMEEGIFANSVAGSFYSCNVTGDDAKKARDAVYKDYQDDIKKWQKAKKNKKEFKLSRDYTYKSPDENSDKNNDGDSDTKKCYAFEVAPLFIKNSGDEGKSLVNDEKMDYYFFTGIIFTIVMVIYLIILCVEVIVRNLKLILFQIIAPIPIINGIDPNDKMRAQWLKSYFSAYLDLFLKIFCIHLLAAIVVVIPKMSDQLGTMGSIFFLIALLTFVKMVPNLISKIFGASGILDSAKEAGGMIKKGLGVGQRLGYMGSGAVLGGAIGRMTASGGKGSKTLGAFRGAIRGATSGAKKDVYGGAKSISATNDRNTRMKADNLGAKDKMAMWMQERVGLTPGEETEKNMQIASGVYGKQDEMKKFLTDKLHTQGMVFSMADQIKTGQIADKTLEVDEQGRQTGFILGKDGKTRIGKVGESVNMKQEYAKQANLQSMTQSEWAAMDVEERKRVFGELAGAKGSLSAAQVFQNDRVAKMEDIANAAKYNQLVSKGDDYEFNKLNNELKDSVSEAHKTSNDDLNSINAVPDMFNDKTLSGIKDTSYKAYNELEAKNAKDLVRKKYMNNSNNQ